MSYKGPLLAIAPMALLLLAMAPNAASVGLADQRVAQKPAPAAQLDRRSHGVIAPKAVCPGQTSIRIPIRLQQRAMRCMTDFARRSVGLGDLGDARKLNRSAAGKSADILRCDSFSHFACGRDFTYWMRQSGYLRASCWRAAENLGIGMAWKKGAVRTIFRGWMESPVHRRNILARQFRELGISLRIGSLAGRDGTHIWTQHFGSHCR